MKSISLAFLFVVQSLIAAPPASDLAVEFEFEAAPRICINREQANKEGVSVDELSKRVEAFFEARDQFTLDELKSIEIPTHDGRAIKLSQVASIEVTFRKAPPKAPAEQDSADQPATRPAAKSQGGDKPQPEAEARSR